MVLNVYDLDGGPCVPTLSLATLLAVRRVFLASLATSNASPRHAAARATPRLPPCR
eukprot:CAMPEP_0183797572 /NCGR_PEP_ID=MMETSP0803_2-20130417/16279_1 /TAXON_ID=195967 /ORGANISM="Crustomastix stigmata, Strain CCMP3273" /LENGTH=55 /DNA_ID=CAMNT_0026042245 /DNA_START=1 /DNA_END=165 /DNA_ORIENTATION=-